MSGAAQQLVAELLSFEQTREPNGEFGPSDGSTPSHEHGSGGQESSSIDPITGIEVPAGVTLDTYSPSGAPDIVGIGLIKVDDDKRGEGLARTTMERLNKYADEHGKTLALSPSKDFGAKIGKLTDFYKSLGFSKNTGSGRELRVRESYIRKPVVTASGRLAFEQTRESNGQFGPGDGSASSGGSLTAAQQESVIAYQGRGAYGEINGSLREGRQPDEATQQHIDNLNAAIAAQPPLEEPLVVGRVIDTGSAEAATAFMEDNNGVSLTDHGFVSTTTDLTSQSSAPGRIACEITLPAGTKALDVNQALGRSSTFHQEAEVILPPGSTFTINGVNSDGVVQLTYVP